MNTTPEQYRADLASVGMVADHPEMKSSADPTGFIDAAAQEMYNKTVKRRSDQVKNVMDRLNRGGKDTPTIDEIMAIPEIAEAERANEGIETINLPNREQIRENGYRQAMQKGSWNGKDYSGEVQRNRRMDIVIGLPGSGKSSVYTERLSQEHKSRVIDTDDFREYIPEYNGSNASVVHEEASSIRNRVLLEALDNGDNLLLSTIGANGEKLAKQISQFKEDGYQVYLHLNELPNNKSLARAIGRYISEEGKLGRYVSPQLIAAYGDKPTETYLYLTGQGGNGNGRLGSNLRTIGGQSSKNAGGESAAKKSAAVPADLLAGYDWYNNDVPRDEAPRLIQTSEQAAPQVQNAPVAIQNSTPTMDTHRGVQAGASNVQGQSAEGGQGAAPSTLGMQAAPSGDYSRSKTFTDTGLRSADEDIRRAYTEITAKDPKAALYEKKHNRDMRAVAKERTATPELVQAEAEYLLDEGTEWTPEDNVTAALAIKALMKEGGEGSERIISRLAGRRKDVNNKWGQGVESNRIIGTMKDAGSTLDTLETVINTIDDLEAERTTWDKAKHGDFDAWKQKKQDSITRIAMEIERVPEGDTKAMRDIIHQLAVYRRTTAWFGTRDNLTGTADKVLSKLEFEDLKKIANTQIACIPDDLRRRGAAEVAMTTRKQSMLSSLSTFVRNIGGNAASGAMGSLSDSTLGRIGDVFMSKYTGKRTVGNDLKHSKEYLQAAKEAGQFASLCVELNIPIETDADSSYSAVSGEDNSRYLGRTFRADGNLAMRAMYAYQKYMSYALEVSDKVFQGGTNAAVEASLQELGSDLSEDEVSRLSQFEGNKRTLKDATWKDTKDGREVTKGSQLSQLVGDVKKAAKRRGGIVGEVAADAMMPFSQVPMNSAQAGIDYTLLGSVKGLGEMIGIIKDAKAGKDIPVERQRQAATDIGKGITGAGVVALFAIAAAHGIVRDSSAEDYDEHALEQAEGREGAQINWSALERVLNGGSGEWQDGDVISGLDFLEPFNTQIYLGIELSKAEGLWDYLKRYPGGAARSAWKSLTDSPMMEFFQNAEDTIDAIGEAETSEDVGHELLALGADTATSFIPQWLRQTAQATDGYYRDTKGDNAAETAVNKFKAAIPGLSDTLPKKYSGLGEEQKRGSGFDIFVDPTDTKRYEENPVTTYLQDLSEETGEKNIFPDRQAPKKITVDGEDVPLDAKQRETYQKTYGENVNALYTELMNNKDFRKLTPAQQAEALAEAKTTAAAMAKAAVSDYDEAPKGSAKSLAKDIYHGTVRRSFDRAMEDYFTATGKGKDSTKASEALDDAYDFYKGLNGAEKRTIREDLDGKEAKYVEARDAGVSHRDFLTVAKGIDNVKGSGKYDPETGKNAVKDIDRYKVIANANISDAAKDKLMLAYMEDYKQGDEDTKTTELKYQYIRQELGLSPQEYITAYNSNQDGGKWSERRSRIMDRLGCDWATANKLILIFEGQQKQQLIDWYGHK